MTRLIDITDQRFARLVAIERGPNTAVGGAQWWCRCDCGCHTLVRTTYLRSGHTQSCGCLQREMTQRARGGLVHGHAANSRRSPTYRTWESMIARCANPSSISYRYYGGRGIGVCERWLRFENFLMDMGERPPGKTIDRKDNDKGYEPGNCRWATPAQQVANRRRAVR